MKWQCNFSIGSKNFKTEAEVIGATHQIEQIQVTGNGISIVMQNNRPLLDAIGSGQSLTWKHIGGEMKDQAVLQAIMQSLEKQMSRSGGRLAQTGPVSLG